MAEINVEDYSIRKGGNTIKHRFVPILALLVILLAAGTSYSAEKIFTGGDADGYAFRTWAGGFMADVNTFSTSINFSYSSANSTSSTGVLIFNTSTLAGRTLSPGSRATLNFFSTGISGSNLKHYAGDPGAEVVWSFATATGNQITALNCGNAWQSIDVTSFVQAAIDGNWGRTAFLFIADDGSSGALASGESGNAAFLEIAPVPEPGSLFALAAGISGLAASLARRKR